MVPIDRAFGSHNALLRTAAKEPVPPWFPSTVPSACTTPCSRTAVLEARLAELSGAAPAHAEPSACTTPCSRTAVLEARLGELSGAAPAHAAALFRRRLQPWGSGPLPCHGLDGWIWSGGGLAGERTAWRSRSWGFLGGS
ncbi:hypothetical protein PVAP13_5KG701300 [Panicum virgatum]|uniref:Uncharacterized protein n=1 Tax=Panicum virgatum TaxID=38727 RepID=A0A8T0SVH3_PANVG|nr:hypothetical protein PVAP13_5KG701300 [Panicum virgatum]